MEDRQGSDQAVADHADEAIVSLLRFFKDRPAWCGPMPKGRWRLDVPLGESKGLFDGESYLARNSDVAAADMGPLQQYIF